jgi:hypothetical protein
MVISYLTIEIYGAEEGYVYLSERRLKYLKKHETCAAIRK